MDNRDQLNKKFESANTNQTGWETIFNRSPLDLFKELKSMTSPLARCLTAFVIETDYDLKIKQQCFAIFTEFDLTEPTSSTQLFKKIQTCYNSLFTQINIPENREKYAPLFAMVQYLDALYHYAIAESTGKEEDKNVAYIKWSEAIYFCNTIDTKAANELKPLHLFSRAFTQLFYRNNVQAALMDCNHAYSINFQPFKDTILKAIRNLEKIYHMEIVPENSQITAAFTHVENLFQNQQYQTANVLLDQINGIFKTMANKNLEQWGIYHSWKFLVVFKLILKQNTDSVEDNSSSFLKTALDLSYNLIETIPLLMHRICLGEDFEVAGNCAHKFLANLTALNLACKNKFKSRVVEEICSSLCRALDNALENATFEAIDSNDDATDTDTDDDSDSQEQDSSSQEQKEKETRKQKALADKQAALFRQNEQRKIANENKSNNNKEKRELAQQLKKEAEVEAESKKNEEESFLKQQASLAAIPPPPTTSKNAKKRQKRKMKLQQQKELSLQQQHSPQPSTSGASSSSSHKFFAASDPIDLDNALPELSTVEQKQSALIDSCLNANEIKDLLTTNEKLAPYTELEGVGSFAFALKEIAHKKFAKHKEAKFSDLDFSIQIVKTAADPQGEKALAAIELILKDKFTESPQTVKNTDFLKFAKELTAKKKLSSNVNSAATQLELDITVRKPDYVTYEFLPMGTAHFFIRMVNQKLTFVFPNDERNSKIDQICKEGKCRIEPPEIISVGSRLKCKYTSYAYRLYKDRIKNADIKIENLADIIYENGLLQKYYETMLSKIEMQNKVYLEMHDFLKFNVLPSKLPVGIAREQNPATYIQIAFAALLKHQGVKNNVSLAKHLTKTMFNLHGIDQRLFSREKNYFIAQINALVGYISGDTTEDIFTILRNLNPEYSSLPESEKNPQKSSANSFASSSTGQVVSTSNLPSPKFFSTANNAQFPNQQHPVNKNKQRRKKK